MREDELPTSAQAIMEMEMAFRRVLERRQAMSKHDLLFTETLRLLQGFPTDVRKFTRPRQMTMGCVTAGYWP